MLINTYNDFVLVVYTGTIEVQQNKVNKGKQLSNIQSFKWLINLNA